MIKTIRLLKGSRCTPWFIGVLCVSVLILGMPAKAPAPTAVEYAVMLALIIVVCITADVSNQPWHVAYGVVSSQLKTAYFDAQDANLQGDKILELTRLSKMIGAAEALMGITSSCDACDEIRSALQQIIGYASLLKSQAHRVSRCRPDGIIQGNEQCDPLAVPTGCPPDTRSLSYFCNDECVCEPITIIP